MQLIPRLYDVLSGKVEVGGVNVKDYELETLRNSVAMVLQKNVLFSGTIKENLKWGNENATDEEIIAACKAASAHDFVSSFPRSVYPCRCCSLLLRLHQWRDPHLEDLLP